MPFAVADRQGFWQSAFTTLRWHLTFKHSNLGGFFDNTRERNLLNFEGHEILSFHEKVH